MSGPPSPSNLSSVTLVGSTGSGGQEKYDETPTEGAPQFSYGRAPTSPLPERKVPKRPARTIEITATTDTIVTSFQQTILSPPTVTKTYCDNNKPIDSKPSFTAVTTTITTATTGNFFS